MMWLTRLKPLVAVAAALILATAGVAVQGRQKPASEGAREQAKPVPPPAAGAGAAAAPAAPDMAANRALAREQLALIDKALATMQQMAQNGMLSLADASFSVWGRRRLETLRKAGAGKAEIVAALEKHLNSLKREKAIAKARFDSGQGTQLEINEVQFRRLEAEIWLNEEKAR